MNAKTFTFTNLRVLSMVALFTTGASHAGIVLSVTPEEKAPPPKETINVPKPKDATEPKVSSTSPTRDLLAFTNKDMLHGVLLGIDSQTGVRWQNPDAKQPIDFKTANLSRIKLEGRNPPANAQTSFSVRLTNDDELLGDIATLDSEKLELDTWYAGRLTIPRKMVRGITPLQANSAVIYEGPANMEGWKTGEGQSAWKFQNGNFMSTQSGSIGRDFKLPDMVSIDFDLTWRPYLNINISLFSDTVENYGGNCYMLQLNSSYVYLQRMRPNGNSSNLGQVQLDNNIQTRTKARIGLRANRETKTIALLIDGVMVKQWTDRGEFAGKGGGVVFYSQGQGLSKVSNIKIMPWDGKFEERTTTSAKTKEDVVRLENNDKVSGRLESIKDGNITFTSAFAKLDIPLKRIQQVDMSAENADQVKRAPGDVRASFSGRGSITFSLEKWDDKTITAKSANFGQANFSPQAFESVQFNLDQQPPKDDDTEFPVGEAGAGAMMEQGMMINVEGGFKRMLIR